jgi:hypothetical protein
MATQTEINEIVKKLRAERAAKAQPVDRDLLERQRNARVNTVMRSGLSQRNRA